MTTLISTLNSVFSSLSSSYQFISDYYQRFGNDPYYFAINNVYERTASSNIGVSSLGVLSAWTPQLVVVSGDKQNILQVTRYGEGDYFDEKARQPLDMIKTMAGTENIINMQEKQAIVQRKKIKPFLTEEVFLDNVFSSSKTLFQESFQDWRNDLSYQDNITHPTAKIIAECVLGIPDLNLEQTQLMRKFGRVLREGNPHSEDFIASCKQMSGLNDTLLTQHQDSLAKTENYIKEKAEIAGINDEKEKLEKLKSTRGISNLLVENNLSALIMIGIAYVHRSKDIIQQLRDEVASHENLDLKTLRKLPYLDCIYKESLRFASPTPMVVRETSHATNITIKDEKGMMKPYSIAPHSLLFAPIRRIHNDPRYWKNPEQFNPARFLDPNSLEHFIPFSLGKRSCPAASNFNEIVFKSALLASLDWEITLDQELEEIPAASLDSRWHTEYYATRIKHSEHNFKCI